MALESLTHSTESKNVFADHSFYLKYFFKRLNRQLIIASVGCLWSRDDKVLTNCNHDVRLCKTCIEMLPQDLLFSLRISEISLLKDSLHKQKCNETVVQEPV